MTSRFLSYNAKRSKLYRKLNPLTDEQKAQRRAYMRAYYLANREHLLDYQKEVRRSDTYVPRKRKKKGSVSSGNEQSRVSEEVPSLERGEA